MNVGFAIGAEIADYFRDLYGDSGGAEVLGIEFTTYQIIILVGFVLNIPDFIAILIMRDGAEMSENGLIVPEEKKEDTGLAARLAETKSERLPSHATRAGKIDDCNDHSRCHCVYDGTYQCA